MRGYVDEYDEHDDDDDDDASEWTVVDVDADTGVSWSGEGVLLTSLVMPLYPSLLLD